MGIHILRDSLVFAAPLSLLSPPSTASLFVDASPQSPLVASRLPWSLPRTFPSSFPSTVMKFSIVLLAAAATAAIASPINANEGLVERGFGNQPSTTETLVSTEFPRPPPMKRGFGNQPSTTETLVSTEFPRPPPMA